MKVFRKLTTLWADKRRKNLLQTYFVVVAFDTGWNYERTVWEVHADRSDDARSLAVDRAAEICNCSTKYIGFNIERVYPKIKCY